MMDLSTEPVMRRLNDSALYFHLKPYKNFSGKSGVLAFETGTDFINIKFTDSHYIYTYNYKKPGKKFVEQLKKLADDGKGLSTYISQEVRENYFSKG